MTETNPSHCDLNGGWGLYYSGSSTAPENWIWTHDTSQAGVGAGGVALGKRFFRQTSSMPRVLSLVLSFGITVTYCKGVIEPLVFDFREESGQILARRDHTGRGHAQPWPRNQGLAGNPTTMSPRAERIGTEPAPQSRPANLAAACRVTAVSIPVSPGTPLAKLWSST